MRHPLRAVFPPVQSTTQQTKQNKQVTGSQPLKQHENTQSYLLLLRSHVSFRPPPDLHQRLRLQVPTISHSSTSDRSTSETWRNRPIPGLWDRPYVPPGFHNISTGFGADKSSSSFRPRDLIFIFFVFEKQYLPGFLSQISAGPRLSRSYLCASLAPGTKPTISSVVFCLRSFNHTEAQGFLRSSAQGSSQVSPILSVIVQNFEAHGNVPFFPARFCNHHCRNSVDSEFSTGDSWSLVLETHLDPTWVHKAGLPSFSSRYLCQSSDNSFRTWLPKSDRPFSCLRGGKHCKHPVAPSSPSRRPTWLQRTVCSPSVAWFQDCDDYWSSSSSCVQNLLVLVDSFHPVCFI